MADFLLELLSEEIPARMQAKARADLERLFVERMGAVGLTATAVETYATPRRLILVARGLPLETDAVREERRGPRADAPDQAIQGFLKSTGLGRDQLEEREDKKGRFLFATVERPGQRTASVLAEAIKAVIRVFPWPKSMRWGMASASADALRWVRPLQNILALLGDEIVQCDIAGVTSGAATLGHRFHHPGSITIGSAADYAEKLRACHVLIDPEERRRLIAEGARAAAAKAGLILVEDEGLATENAGLTEWPVPLLGSFDPAFLELPREVIQLTMRTNQKYFACVDPAGALAPYFVCTANIDGSDGGEAIVAGNQKVLAARLSDAKFFWEQDLKVPLEQQAERLDQIVFHEKLGSVAAKVDRVAKLARWLVQERIVAADRDEVDGAARLAKADLVSEIVGEFPELQGIMGAYLARAQGKSDAVADAIRDHYRPLGPTDAVPDAPATIALALADKVDTLVAFFSIGEKPTGSRDPFALRRAALGVLQIIVRNGLRLSLKDVIIEAAVLLQLSQMGALHTASFPHLLEEEEGDHEITAEVGSFTYRSGGKVVVRWDSAATPTLERGKFIEQAIDLQEEVFAFLAERLKVQQREAGVRHDLIDAVFAAGGEDDMVRLLARVGALQAFVESGVGADLLAGYKRAANILRKEDWNGGQRNTFFSYDPEPAERALDSVLDAVEPRAKAALAAEDFEGAMAALASLRGPVDDFFDQVTVNDSDPEKRETRLILLARIRHAVADVADFSKIEGRS
ncbi:glycine--tRNA ligase subunit beta [Sphingosinicella rhizophila]|uniref:Glycine--tRNA ligase beta subunit n=1 Tax=Sphingosinicella rhizophila TaxID=3050082 RepID=A0ABU3Q688_9SPHN|nr:glycine--tRNA ligase subunit beta [Sphingosinicella sp. GR2756]MDT9598450.1 glycine--tRNA ligase subunit beta [Sphingosinicella sp. GR2756]